MSNTTCQETLNYVSLNQELKRLKVVVKEIKNENIQLLSMLSNICITMKRMCEEHKIKLEIKDHEIALLREELKQSENEYLEEDDGINIKNGYETNSNKESALSEMTLDTESHTESNKSSCSSSIIEEISSQSSKTISVSSNKKLDNNLESNVDRQIRNNPSDDEWFVTSKKPKGQRKTKKPKEPEVIYPAGLEVSDGWTHLHLYNVILGTPEKQVLKYIKTLSGCSECTVRLLKTKDKKYASFKIGLPAELAEKVLRPENWTGNIRIKPWSQNPPPKKNIEKASQEANKKTNEKEAKVVTTTQNSKDLKSKAQPAEKEVKSSSSTQSSEDLKSTSSSAKPDDKETKNVTSTQKTKDLKSETSSAKPDHKDSDKIRPKLNYEDLRFKASIVKLVTHRKPNTKLLMKWWEV